MVLNMRAKNKSWKFFVNVCYIVKLNTCPIFFFVKKIFRSFDRRKLWCLMRHEFSRKKKVRSEWTNFGELKRCVAVAKYTRIYSPPTLYARALQWRCCSSFALAMTLEAPTRQKRPPCGGGSFIDVLATLLDFPPHSLYTFPIRNCEMRVRHSSAWMASFMLKFTVSIYVNILLCIFLYIVNSFIYQLFNLIVMVLHVKL